MINGNIKPCHDTLRGERHLCRVASQTTIQAHAQAKLFVRYRSAGCITNETHCKIVKRQCSKTPKVVMRSLPEKLFHVYLPNFWETQGIYGKFISFAIGSNAPTCIEPVCNDEPRSFIAHLGNTSQSYNNEDKHSNTAIQYKLLERHGEQADRQRAFKTRRRFRTTI